jgi:hypothetical protein
MLQLVREFRWSAVEASLEETPELLDVRDEKGRNWKASLGLQEARGAASHQGAGSRGRAYRALTLLPRRRCHCGCIDRPLERNEEHTRVCARAPPTVHRLSRAVRVHPGSENGGLLPVVGDVQLARNQDHSLGGSVPVGRQVVPAWHSEEDVSIGLRRIAVEHRDLTTRRKEAGTRAPLEAGVACTASQRALPRYLFRIFRTRRSA